MKIVLAVTGASGSIYARRFLEVLSREGIECHLLFSIAGEQVAKHETGIGPVEWISTLDNTDTVKLWNNEDLFAPFASGSNGPDGMVVLPCSMGTLGKIAAGTAENLLTRAADVCLKERIPLILAVRETPLNLIHLENMTRIARAGGIILPASPGFYHHPETIDDLVNHLVGKVCDILGINHNLYRRWMED